jgi:pimeloyl-ACP methyl ester carboxylesterase
LLQQIVDSPRNPDAQYQSSEEKYFDIIGFDPRGINNTTPSTDCFPDDVTLGAWAQQARGQGFPRSNESFAFSWSRQISMAKSCSWRLGQDDVMEIGRYMSTPSVVEDMLVMIEALGQWREEEALKLMRKDSTSMTGYLFEQIRSKRGKERLLYWGFSYGTLLGSTFAAMHPDRIERMALDGVVDAEDYYSSE